MRFFLGGVPFGCDNIGDEAILECIVSIIRRNFPSASITVSTAKPKETARLLGVDCVELFAFDGKRFDGLKDALKKCDVFMWAGATGLSDYPDTALKIISAALDCGLKTVVWGVGMNSVFNPAFFKLGGKKLFLCSVLKKMSLSMLDFQRIAEDIKIGGVKRRLRDTLSKCDLIVVRDEPSACVLETCGLSRIAVGADSALLLKPSPLEKTGLPANMISTLKSDDFEKIGICVSAQSAIKRLDDFALCIDELLQKSSRRAFFIPMNPVTDFALMDKLRDSLKFRDRTFIVENCENPSDVEAIAEYCSVVVSSRLHLLILSANVGTPIVGISRGSKVDNFLANFGLSSVGNVDDCDFDALKKQVEGFLSDSSEFKAECGLVCRRLLARLSEAEDKLRAVLGGEE